MSVIVILAIVSQNDDLIIDPCLCPQSTNRIQATQKCRKRNEKRQLGLPGQEGRAASSRSAVR